VFATRNKGKLVELRELLPGVAVLSVDEAASQLACTLPDVVEDADTFAGNAIKKAREVSAATGLPALADDSGLEVDALDGAPGVYSARYAGDQHDDAANNTKLLGALAGVPRDRRTARFRAVLALADVAGPLGTEVLTADGTCEGIILDAPRGTGGFGYDPLFFAPELGQTFAEAGVGPKSDLSHRARAMKAMKPRLLAYLMQRCADCAANFLRALHRSSAAQAIQLRACVLAWWLSSPCCRVVRSLKTTSQLPPSCSIRSRSVRTRAANPSKASSLP
jgi:XTP/dITP diphosphohydrolase